MSPEDTSFDSDPPNLVSRFFHSVQRPNSGRTPSCAEMWLPLDRIKYRRLRREIGALLSTILEPSSATGMLRGRQHFKSGPGWLSPFLLKMNLLLAGLGTPAGDFSNRE